MCPQQCVHHLVRMEVGVSGPTGAAAVKAGVGPIAPGECTHTNQLMIDNNLFITLFWIYHC